MASRRDRRLSIARDTVRSELWPVPVAGVLLALVAGVALPQLDTLVDSSLPAVVSGYLFGGGAAAARTVLDAVASSLITVTSLTFSLTVVTLQLASSQFSPRLLRTFTRDRFVHTTLALFLATFVYALTVLRTVRTAADGRSEFVPQLSVTLAFVLAVASVVLLVLFLAHLAREIRVETMLKTVRTEASETVRRALPEPGECESATPVPPDDAIVLTAGSSGFLLSIEEDELLAVAIDADVVVLIDRAPGGSLVAGTPVGACWSHSGDLVGVEQLARLRDRVATALAAGFERTSAQDVEFGLRQLTDVANKALSPGINDPTTAVHALGHVSALLCEMADRDLGPRLLRDDTGAVRVALRRPELADLLELALTQPRRYGAADPFVMIRIAELLAEVGWRSRRPQQRRAIVDHLTRVRATVAAQDFDATERALFGAAVRQVDNALDRRWTPAPTHP